VVDRLLQHGAIVMGKANMHELALGVTSSNPTFGFVHNPYNPDVIPGGSSGGSAAAIAARIVPAALGTDTGGSVRIPAAFCGIVGFRPSICPRRLYSTQGVVPLAHNFDTIGPMGRSIPDVAMLHTTIVGEPLVHPGSLEKARIGVPRVAYWDDLDPEVERVAKAALTRLRDEGAVLVEIDLREVKDAAYKYVTLESKIVADLENFLRTQVPSVSPCDVLERVGDCNFRARGKKWAEAGLDPNLHNARGPDRDAICRAYREVFRQNGIRAVVFPTVVIPPPPIRASGADKDEMIELNGRMVSELLTTVRNTFPTAALGTPAVSLPAGLTTNGLPVGLEFDGTPGNDSALLALAMAAESAIGRVPAPHMFVPRSPPNSDADLHRDRLRYLSKR
jgi:mandelamide amidase